MAAAFAAGFDLADLGEYRLAALMTQIAHEDGLTDLTVSHDEVNRWRRGKRIVPLWAMDLLAAVVECSVDELIARAKGRPTIEAQRAGKIREAQQALEAIRRALLRADATPHARAV